MHKISEGSPSFRLKSIRENRPEMTPFSNPLPVIEIGSATCGIAAGALETRKAFKQALSEFKIEAKIHSVGCLGHCYAEPLVMIHHPDSGFPPIFYHEVHPGKAEMLVRQFLGQGDPCFEHVYGAAQSNDLVPSVHDFSRFNRETRIVMGNCGHIDPESLFEYLDSGGYQGLAKALELPPLEVIREIRNSGLRGRGGAGFPTGQKWEMAFRAARGDKIIVCNADEGDPGAYMDRTLLESNPYQVLEGMVICAHAVGARKGYIYIRAEYPLAIRIIARAISQATASGLLGSSILGTPLSLTIDLFTGSGAFVCGEETALIHSMEGYRGMPRHRPPFPVEQGFEKKPTVINNVKTFASIPPIITNGGAWYRSIGTEGSAGTALFSIVGDVVHSGLVEIPMGVTLRDLIFNICGGIPKKKKFKAVQIGGPSGGCLPEPFLDIPVDFDSLRKAGAMMGSGGMVVMDEDTCMVDVARFFIDFTRKESCGKCTFCRIGTHHIFETLNRITEGKGRPGDLELLVRLSEDIRRGSLCGLGKTAPNPILTSIRYFMDEYEAHIREGRCPALRCRPLIAYYIDLDKCARGCDVCVGCCPTDAVFTTSTRKKGIDQERCVKCGECLAACPPDYNAVRKISPPHLAPVIPRPAGDSTAH
ncbi:MAG: NADH-ubiquinone oxidoreductase-F iron-sulfur binding region domain-containing protein [Thermodesulfobacteriota bacterium]